MKLFSKKLGLLLMGALMAGSILTSAAQAVTINPDADVFVPLGANIAINSQTLETAAYANLNLQTSYLKFDVSSLLGTDKDLTFKIYGHINSGDIEAKYVSSGWDLNSIVSTPPATLGSLGEYTTETGTTPNSWYVWTITSADLASKSTDSLLSIAVSSTSNGSYMFSSASFNSNENIYKPSITGEGPSTPNTPEPSALILGAMSLGGFLVRRKK